MVAKLLNKRVPKTTIAARLKSIPSDEPIKVRATAIAAFPKKPVTKMLSLKLLLSPDKSAPNTESRAARIAIARYTVYAGGI